MDHFSKTALSGGLTIIYGYVDERRSVNRFTRDYKNIVIRHCTSSGNSGFTAGAMLFDSYLVRDKQMQANLKLIDCTFADNIGYDTIISVNSNTGNREYDVFLEMDNLHLISNRLLHQPILNDPLIAYRHQPLISTLHLRGIRIVTFTNLIINHNQLRGVSIIELSRVVWRGDGNLIANNRGTEGGGMRLWNAPIELKNPTSKLVIENNTASLSGGGLYITTPTRVSFCFSMSTPITAKDYLYHIIVVLFSGIIQHLFPEILSMVASCWEYVRFESVILVIWQVFRSFRLSLIFRGRTHLLK